VKIIVDGGPDDTNAIAGRISGNLFTLTDSTGFSYTFDGYNARFTYSPTGGLDGARYSLTANITDLFGTSVGKSVSMYTSVSDFTSIIGEPARVSTNATLSLQGDGLSNPNNRAAVTYGAYYDNSNALTTSPSGVTILSGGDNLVGGSNSSEAISTTPVNTSNFSSSSFSMGVFYSAQVNSVAGADTNEFTFTGSTTLEQTPEPSHTALPVGIAAGLLVLRRRRVTC